MKVAESQYKHVINVKEETIVSLKKKVQILHDELESLDVENVELRINLKKTITKKDEQIQERQQKMEDMQKEKLASEEMLSRSTVNSKQLEEKLRQHGSNIKHGKISCRRIKKGRNSS